MLCLFVEYLIRWPRVKELLNTFAALIKVEQLTLVRNVNTVNTCYSYDELINEIDTIVDNSYIVFHGKVYRQKIGIPMGTNCAPFLANIFLHTYEYDYLTKLVADGHIETAKLLANTYRYQDDCVAINDNGAFKEHFSFIYPTEMTLENTNISKAVCTFLDLRISVFRGKFRYCSYDKRRDFNFDICNYPNLMGNVPWGGSYGVYTSQLVRFCEINLNVETFVSDIKYMTEKFVKQGFLKSMLKDIYLKFTNKYFYKWGKYGVSITKYCDKIFNSDLPL